MSGDNFSATSSTGVVFNDPRSRSRDGRTITGVATARENVGIGGGLDFPLFGPWGRYPPWFTGGYGYVSYNPFVIGDTRWNWYRYGSWYNPYSIYGYYDPWYDSWYDPYYYGGYGSYGSYGSSYSSSRSSKGEERETTGSLRVKVKPAHAKLYLDGTLIGTVDDFDGLTGHLSAEAGTHQLEFRADGYQPLTKTVTVEAGKTTTTRASLKKK